MGKHCMHWRAAMLFYFSSPIPSYRPNTNPNDKMLENFGENFSAFLARLFTNHWLVVIRSLKDLLKYYIPSPTLKQTVRHVRVSAFGHLRCIRCAWNPPPRSHRRYHFSPLIPLCKPPQPFAVGRYTLPLNSFSTLLSETKLSSRKCLLPWLKLLRALLPFFFNSLFFWGVTDFLNVSKNLQTHEPVQAISRVFRSA